MLNTKKVPPWSQNGASAQYLATIMTGDIFVAHCHIVALVVACAQLWLSICGQENPTLKTCTSVPVGRITPTTIR